MTASDKSSPNDSKYSQLKVKYSDPNNRFGVALFMRSSEPEIDYGITLGLFASELIHQQDDRRNVLEQEHTLRVLDVLDSGGLPDLQSPDQMYSKIVTHSRLRDFRSFDSSHPYNAGKMPGFRFDERFGMFDRSILGGVDFSQGRLRPLESTLGRSKEEDNKRTVHYNVAAMPLLKGREKQSRFILGEAPYIVETEDGTIDTSDYLFDRLCDEKSNHITVLSLLEDKPEGMTTFSEIMKNPRVTVDSIIKDEIQHTTITMGKIGDKTIKHLAFTGWKDYSDLPFEARAAYFQMLQKHCTSTGTIHCNAGAHRTGTTYLLLSKLTNPSTNLPLEFKDHLSALPPSTLNFPPGMPSDMEQDIRFIDAMREYRPQAVNPKLHMPLISETSLLYALEGWQGVTSPERWESFSKNEAISLDPIELPDGTSRLSWPALRFSRQKTAPAARWDKADVAKVDNVLIAAHFAKELKELESLESLEGESTSTEGAHTSVSKKRKDDPPHPELQSKLNKRVCLLKNSLAKRQ